MANLISLGTQPYKLGSPPDFGTLYSGRALEFDGVTDYVDLGSSLFSTTGDFTYSSWFYLTSDPSEYDTITYSGSDASLIRFRASSSPWYIEVKPSNSGNACRTDGNPFYIQTWYNFVTTRDSGVLSIYLNGALDRTDISNANAMSMRYFAHDSGTRYTPIKLSNFQVWDKAWSLSDVQYAYTHPEKLITDNSAVTSGTTISNLKAWYPCTEGNPRSPQTTVYDGSPKELGSEMMDTGESTYETGTGSWTTVGTNTVTNVDGQVVITYGDTSNNASLNYLNASGATTVNTVDGKVYRLQIDAKYGGTPDSGVPSMKLRNEAGDQSWDLSTEMTTYVRYFTDEVGGAPYLAPQNMAGTGTTVTVDKLSLKLVNGNPGIMTSMAASDIVTDTP